MPKKLRPVLFNVLLKKCPRCQREDLFTKPFMLADPLAMPKTCPTCHQKFEPEPGFYYGAMFISYIVSSMFFLGMAALLILIFGLTVNQTFAIIILLGIFGFLWLVRISRAIWIHIVISFNDQFDHTA